MYKVRIMSNIRCTLYVGKSFCWYVYLPTPLLKNVKVEEGGPQPYWFFAAVFLLQELFMCLSLTKSYHIIDGARL